MRDLDNPQLIGQYDGPSGSIDHNLYIRDGLVYEANYRAGLRILDGAPIASGTLTEIGYFDIFSADDAVGYNGAWSSYPFFEEGLVIVSGIEQGMFALRPQFEPGFRLAVTPSRVTRCGDEPLGLTLSIEQVGDFAAQVTISTETNADAPSLVPTAATQMPNTTQPLNIVSTNVLTGTYSISVTGNTVSQTHSTTLLVHQLAYPITETPSDGASEVDLRPLFTWTGDAATNYRVMVASDAAFTDVVLDEIVPGTSYQPMDGLDGNTTYYWRISAESGACADSPSAPGSFTTKPRHYYLPIVDSGG